METVKIKQRSWKTVKGRPVKKPPLLADGKKYVCEIRVFTLAEYAKRATDA